MDFCIPATDWDKPEVKKALKAVIGVKPSHGETAAELKPELGSTVTRYLKQQLQNELYIQNTSTVEVTHE